MLKILNVKTGHTFILPDEEVMRLKKQDRSDELKIIDAGYQEEEQTTVSKEAVKELVEKTEKRAEEIEEADKEPVKEYYTELNLKKFSKADLIGAIRRVGGKANDKDTKPVLIQKMKDLGIKL